MVIDEAKVKEILLQEAYVTPEDIKKAEEFAKAHHTQMVDYLLSKEIITKELLGQALAESFKVPYANLKAHQPAKEQVEKIPELLAKKYQAVVFEENEDQIRIATDDPTQEQLLADLKTVFKEGKKISLAYGLQEEIQGTFIHYRKSLETRFSDIIKKQKQVAPQIIDEILADALSYMASDIHFEPQEEEVVIRFRIDGVLHEAGRIPKQYYENVLNRIKVQAHLQIDEHFSAQDGAIRYVKEGNKVDMRVSITPILDGEKVVIRLLSKYAQSLTLNDMGLLADNQKLLTTNAKKPFGMILVTGPTGSGKTTTLYGLLKILNNPEVNIATIEDPVEYKIQGVNHIQVNEKTNLTFAEGLRSIVRQDPDIILVGEIRDRETAEIAVNAALTGHLLLSTFHANDAATAIPRLLDMGTEPFLLSSTLELVIAQRLVRRICQTCKHGVNMTQEDLKKWLPDPKLYFSQGTTTLYEGKGCKTCNDTGYKGRLAVYEFIAVTPEMKELILKNPSTQTIWELAKKQGAHSMFEDGIEKVKNGITTLEELLRITSPS